MTDLTLPGLIDVHTHLRVPGGEHKETFATGTAAALAGGMTLLLAMPNTNPPLTTPDALATARRAAAADVRCDVGLFAGAAPADVAHLPALAEGATALQIYLNDTFGRLRVDDLPTLVACFTTWPREKLIALHAERQSVAVAIGLVGLTCFVARQVLLQRVDRALLDLRTFTFGAFSIALLMMALAMMALFGTIIMLPLLLQKAYGLEPLQVGLMMLPGGLAMGVMGPLVGRLYDRLGPRVLVVPASIVVMAAFWFFSSLTPATPWWLIMILHVLMSVSFAFTFTPLFTVALGSLPHRLYSHGSAVVGTVQQVAGAAGTALFVTVFALQSDAARAAGASEAVALLTGSHWAFLGAGAIWTAAVVAGFFLRRPPEDPEAPPVAAH